MSNPSNPYTWTPNALADGSGLPRLANANLEYLKYEIENNLNLELPKYCVNYGYRTHNYADLIISDSTTSVEFKIGGSYPPILLTFPNKNTYCISQLAPLAGLTAGTNYEYIIKEQNINAIGQLAGIISIGYNFLIKSNGDIFYSPNAGSLTSLTYVTNIPNAVKTDGAYNSNYVLDSSGTFHFSSDGLTFTTKGTLANVIDFFCNELKGSIIYVLVSSGTIYKSTDYGSTFTPLGTVVNAACFDGGSGVWSSDGKYHRTFDNFATFEDWGKLPNDAIILKSSSGYASDGNGNVYCIDTQTGVLEIHNQKYVGNIVAIKGDTQSLFVALDNGYILQSGDYLGSIGDLTQSTTINGISYPLCWAIPTAVNLSTNAITAQYGNPPSPTSGDYWLDISTDVSTPYYRNGSTNVVTQYVPIGEGTAASPITYAYNGRYISPDTACVTTTNAVTTFNHNLGTQNYRTMLYLRCITAEAGYTAGQVILAHAALNNTTPYFVMPYQPVVNKNSVSYRSGTYAASPYHGQNQSTGASGSFTPANWKQFVVVERTF